MIFFLFREVSLPPHCEVYPFYYWVGKGAFSLVSPDSPLPLFSFFTPAPFFLFLSLFVVFSLLSFLFLLFLHFCYAFALRSTAFCLSPPHVPPYISHCHPLHHLLVFITHETWALCCLQADLSYCHLSAMHSSLWTERQTFLQDFLLVLQQFNNQSPDIVRTRCPSLPLYASFLR